MEKMRMESLDMTAQNIEKIGALFPNCITETVDENGKAKKAINFELLKQMLSGDVIEGNEAYEFTWVGKKAAIVEANKPIRKTLRPCKEESVNWDTTENLYIEGDNLEVLKLLQESYLGAIKMIYIDPPYNTGSDFIYRDDFKQSTDDYEEDLGVYDEGNRLFKNTDSNGRFHSDWCSMIYSRLILARNLLADDGVIFISIDDNEVINLKKICDEVFGATNFEVDFHIKVRHEKRILREDIRYQLCMEHILCYRKNNYSPNRLPKEKNALDDYRWNVSINKSPKDIIELGGYKIEIYDSSSWSVTDMGAGNGDLKEYQIRGSLITQKGSASEFYEIHLRERRETDGEGTLYKVIGMGEKGDGLGYRYIRQPNDFSFKNGFYYQGKPMSANESKGLPYPNYWDFVVESNNVGEEGGIEYKGGKKPVALIEKMLEIAGITNDYNATVLDFFSGSATTAHAVMNLNKDGGKRKFIMVQLPENLDEAYETASPKNKASLKNTLNFLDKNKKPHFISELGKIRIELCGNELKEYVADIGFRVLKLDDTNMTDVYYAAGDYTQDLLSMLESNVKADRTDLDLLFGCLLEWGLPLSLPYTSEQIEGYTVHTYNDGDLIACFDENIPDSVIKTIAKKQPLRAVFRDSSFANSPSKINVGEVFKLLAPDTRVKVL